MQKSNVLYKIYVCHVGFNKLYISYKIINKSSVITNKLFKSHYHANTKIDYMMHDATIPWAWGDITRLSLWRCDRWVNMKIRCASTKKYSCYGKKYDHMFSKKIIAFYVKYNNDKMFYKSGRYVCYAILPTLQQST